MKKQELKKKAALYPTFVEWSDEDDCFIGRCPDLFEGGVHGSDEAKVYQRLCEVAEEWVTLLAKEGSKLPNATSAKEFRGKFVVRIEPAVHRRIALKAKAEGESLNTFT